MRQQTNLILRKNTFKRTLELCSLMVFSFYCLNGEHALGDSTFFPEDMDIKAPRTNKSSVKGAHISQKTKTITRPHGQDAVPHGQVKAAPHRQINAAPHRQVNAAPQVQIKAAPHRQVNAAPQVQVNAAPHRQVNAAPQVQVNAAPHRQVNAAPQVQVNAAHQVQVKAAPQVQVNAAPQVQAQARPQQPQVQMQASREIQRETLSQAPVSNVATKADSKALQKPLQIATVQPHRKAHPVQEKDQASLSPMQPAPEKDPVPYVEAANNRSPLGILDPKQDLSNQRWYIYSSAKRGLNDSSDKVHIVSMEGATPNRGEEVKTILVSMGMEPEKVQLIHAKGEEKQKGKVYIFAGK